MLKSIHPKFRIYVAEECGLLVRRHQVSNLKRAITLAQSYAEAIDVQIRIFWQGMERALPLQNAQEAVQRVKTSAPKGAPQ